MSKQNCWAVQFCFEINWPLSEANLQVHNCLPICYSKNPFSDLPDVTAMCSSSLIPAFDNTLLGSKVTKLSPVWQTRTDKAVSCGLQK